MDKADIESRFTYHAPSEKNVTKFPTLRSAAKQLAELINELCPEGREKSLAITKLEEVIMWANAGIARDKK